MNTDNLFELATRYNYLFPSAKGQLTTQQLWQLPLLITTPTRDVKVDLDTVARTINAQLRAISEQSFVPTAKPSAKQEVLQNKLEIVRHIIAVKVAERDKAARAKDRAAQREKLLDALQIKQEQALAGLSEADIRKQLEALDAED